MMLANIRRLFLCGVLLSSGAASMAHADTVPVLVIHGGAGIIRKGMTPEREKTVRAALKEALEAGYKLLQEGKSATDAVEASVQVLENNPEFNAGRGAVFTHSGQNEMDAAIMDGATLRVGAVAGVKHVKNPISLARAVMDHSPHVFLIGDGAEAFAKTQGIELVDASWFRTERRWQQLQEALKKDRLKQAKDPDTHHGTVGAVALDRDGHLAAATSTGGLTDKLWGRVGDSPIPGAGTYANEGCAMSGTGWGEYYIRTVAAHEICMRVTVMGQPLDQAAEQVINKEIPQLGGDGGAILVDAKGNIAMPFNTDGMYRAWIGRDGVAHVAILKDDVR